MTITSYQNTGHQTLKDYLTPTEKKVIKHMIETNAKGWRARNKTFKIEDQSEGQKLVTIYTETYSVILGRPETTKHSVTIRP
jgi:hypothetical protein